MRPSLSILRILALELSRRALILAEPENPEDDEGVVELAALQRRHAVDDVYRRIEEWTALDRLADEVEVQTETLEHVALMLNPNRDMLDPRHVVPDADERTIAEAARDRDELARPVAPVAEQPRLWRGPLPGDLARVSAEAIADVLEPAPSLYASAYTSGDAERIASEVAAREAQLTLDALELARRDRIAYEQAREQVSQAHAETLGVADDDLDAPTETLPPIETPRPSIGVPMALGVCPTVGCWQHPSPGSVYCSEHRSERSPE
jgi:hypothetical protein